MVRIGRGRKPAAESGPSNHCTLPSPAPPPAVHTLPGALGRPWRVEKPDFEELPAGGRRGSWDRLRPLAACRRSMPAVAKSWQVGTGRAPVGLATTGRPPCDRQIRCPPSSPRGAPDPAPLCCAPIPVVANGIKQPGNPFPLALSGSREASRAKPAHTERHEAVQCAAAGRGARFH